MATFVAPPDLSPGDVLPAAQLDAINLALSASAANVVSAVDDIVRATASKTLDRIATGEKSGGVLNYKHISKSADQSISNNTFANDTHLLLPVGASEVWIVEGVLIVICTSATPDFKAQWTIPAGAAGGWKPLGGQDASAAAITNNGFPLTSGFDFAIGVSQYALISFQAYIANGATPGNLQLQWAQSVTNAAAMTMKKGSFLRCFKVT